MKQAEKALERSEKLCQSESKEIEVKLDDDLNENLVNDLTFDVKNEKYNI